MTPNLAGLLVVALIAAPALLRWRRATRTATPVERTKTIPFATLGLALLAGVLAATVVAILDMRPAENDVVTIRIPDVPVETLRKDAADVAESPFELSALLVREKDNRIVGRWERAPGESELVIRTPFVADADFVTVSISPGKRNRMWARLNIFALRDDVEHELHGEHGDWGRPGPGGVEISSLKFNDTARRNRNLFSLLTPGSDYRLFVFATPEGRYPMKTVNAGEWLASLDWLLPESTAKTEKALNDEASVRLARNEDWKVLPASQHDLSFRLYQIERNGEPRSGIFATSELWGDAFGPAALVAFIIVPILLSQFFKYRRRAALGIFVAMLLAAVAVERFVAPAWCDAAAYHRFFTVNPRSGASAR